VGRLELAIGGRDWLREPTVAMQLFLPARDGVQENGRGFSTGCFVGIQGCSIQTLGSEGGKPTSFDMLISDFNRVHILRTDALPSDYTCCMERLGAEKNPQKFLANLVCPSTG
jgi:hypothetical protein